MGTPAEKLPDPDSWTPDQADKASALLEAIDAGKTQFKGSPERLSALREARKYYDLTLKDGDHLDGIEDFAQWRAKSALPANDNAQSAQPAAAVAPAEPAVTPSSSWGSLAGVAADKIFGGDIFGNGTRATETPDDVLPGELRRMSRSATAPVYRDDGTDYMRGLGQGATLRTGDELAGGVEGAVSLAQTNTPGAQRAAGRGVNAPLMSAGERFQAATDEGIDRNRADNRMSQERSPYAYGAGELTGAGAVATLTAPVAAAGTPWTAMVLPNAAQGGALGYLAGYGGSEGDSRLSDATTGAAAGALGGAGATALAGKGAEAFRSMGQSVDDLGNAIKSSPTVTKASNYTGNLANRSRAAATGAYGAQLKQLSKNEGFDYVDGGFGTAVEDMFPPQRGLMGIPKPRTARDYAELARPKEDALGAQIGSTLKQLDDQGVSAPVLRDPAGKERAVLDTLDDELAQVRDPMNIGDDDDVMRGALERLHGKTLKLADPATERSLGTGLPRLQATELAKMKRSLERSGYGAEAVKGLPAGVRREANRIAATGPREALRSAVREQADPATAQRFETLNRQFPVAKQVAELSEGRAAQEQGNQIVSLPGAIATAAMGPTAAPAVGVWELAKRYGADASANALRGAQRATQVQFGPRVGSAAADTASDAAFAQTAAAPANTWSALAHAGQTAAAQDAPPPAQAGRSQRVEIGEAVIKPRGTGGEQSLGHMNVQGVRNALRAYPQALGKFKAQLEQAYQAPDPVELSSTVADLQRTSPEFRRVLEQLAAQEELNRSGGKR